MTIDGETSRQAAYALAGIYLFEAEAAVLSTGRIRLGNRAEIRAWTERFGVAEATLRAVVDRVGDQVVEVDRALRAS